MSVVGQLNYSASLDTDNTDNKGPLSVVFSNAGLASGDAIESTRSDTKPLYLFTDEETVDLMNEQLLQDHQPPIQTVEQLYQYAAGNVEIVNKLESNVLLMREKITNITGAIQSSALSILKNRDKSMKGAKLVVYRKVLKQKSIVLKGLDSKQKSAAFQESSLTLDNLSNVSFIPRGSSNPIKLVYIEGSNFVLGDAPELLKNIFETGGLFGLKLSEEAKAQLDELLHNGSVSRFSSDTMSTLFTGEVDLEVAEVTSKETFSNTIVSWIPFGIDVGEIPAYNSLPISLQVKYGCLFDTADMHLSQMAYSLVMKAISFVVEGKMTLLQMTDAFGKALKNSTGLQNQVLEVSLQYIIDLPEDIVELSVLRNKARENFVDAPDDDVFCLGSWGIEMKEKLASSSLSPAGKVALLTVIGIMIATAAMAGDTSDLPGFDELIVDAAFASALDDIQLDGDDKQRSPNNLTKPNLETEPTTETSIVLDSWNGELLDENTTISLSDEYSDSSNIVGLRYVKKIGKKMTFDNATSFIPDGFTVTLSKKGVLQVNGTNINNIHIADGEIFVGNPVNEGLRLGKYIQQMSAKESSSAIQLAAKQFVIIAPNKYQKINEAPLANTDFKVFPSEVHYGLPACDEKQKTITQSFSYESAVDFIELYAPIISFYDQDFINGEGLPLTSSESTNPEYMKLAAQKYQSYISLHPYLASAQSFEVKNKPMLLHEKYANSLSVIECLYGDSPSDKEADQLLKGEIDLPSNSGVHYIVVNRQMYAINNAFIKNTSITKLLDVEHITKYPDFEVDLANGSLEIDSMLQSLFPQGSDINLFEYTDLVYSESLGKLVHENYIYASTQSQIGFIIRKFDEFTLYDSELANAFGEELLKGEMDIEAKYRIFKEFYIQQKNKENSFGFKVKKTFGKLSKWLVR